MFAESPSSRIIKLHKKWSDGLTVLWQLFILLLFGGIYFVIDQFGVAAGERNSMLILLAVMVLVAAIWQAVGLGVARIHMILDGVDLERKGNANIPRLR